jgi:hypothetical protein
MLASVVGFCDGCDEVPGSVAWNFFDQQNVGQSLKEVLEL